MIAVIQGDYKKLAVLAAGAIEPEAVKDLDKAASPAFWDGFDRDPLGHLEFLESVGDPATGLPIGKTSDNLKAAVAGETHEYTDMYPGMARSAREEGFEEIAEWFETLAKAERSHAGRFQRSLDELK